MGIVRTASAPAARRHRGPGDWRHARLRAAPSLACLRANGESRRGISPPRAPRSVREPLGSYGSRCSTADVQLGMSNGFALSTELLPFTGWLWAAAEQRSSFGPVPLQHLHPYYELLRPCAPHR